MYAFACYIVGPMPTNKLWIEHTERAAWDSVGVLRERLLKAESRVQALATGVARVPELLDALDDAKQRYAPEANGHDQVVLELVALVERLQAELQQPKLPDAPMVNFAATPVRSRMDSDDLDELSRSRADDDEPDDLSAFARAMQRRAGAAEPSRDLDRLLSLVENKVDDLNELEGVNLREAAVELAVLAAKIYAVSRTAG